MEKPLIIRIYYKITNLLKIIFIYIVKFFDFLFFKNKMNISNNNDNVKNNNEFKVEKQDNNIRTSTTLPDDNNQKSFNTYSLIYEFDEEKVNKYIDDVIEQVYEIKIENMPELKPDIKKLKEKVIPSINEKIINNEIANDDELKVNVKKDVKKELESKPLIKKKLETFSIVIKDKKPLKIREIPKISEDKSIAKVSKEKEKKIIDKIEEKPITMVKTQSEKTSIIKDEVLNVVAASATLLASMAKDIVTSSTVEENKQEEIVSQSKDIPQVKEEIFSNNVEEIKVEAKEEDKNVDEIKDKIEEVNDKLNEEKDAITDDKIDNIDEELMIARQSIDEEQKQLMEDMVHENQISDLNDKISKSIEKIDNFIVENESKLTNKQKEILKEEKEKLNNTQEKLSQEQILNIQNEEQIIRQNILNEEKESLLKKIESMQIEHQLDLNENNLQKVEDIDKKAAPQIAYTEKKLLKRKLKRVSRALELKSILLLPFIRNKYFWFFTGGLIINNHFRFMSNILTHKTQPMNLPNLDELRQGQDALTSSINITIENLEYLNILKNEILYKYPELENDESFMKILENTQNKLENSYHKLTNKQELIDKYIYKTKKNIKVLKRQKEAV